MSSAVLDSSAILAYLLGERGAEVVARLLSQGTYISAVNWAETLSKMGDGGEDPEIVINRLRSQGILDQSLEVLPLAEQDALIIAQLRPLTRPNGLSLGDRACLALGKRLSLPVFTADRQWFTLVDVLDMDIQAIR